jgi:hypothetical protein
MTERLFPDEMQRPRRQAGELLRLLVKCPLDLCRGDVRVVAYRTLATRFECRSCGLRFSVRTEAIVDGMRGIARGWRADPLSSGFPIETAEDGLRFCGFLDGLDERVEGLDWALSAADDRVKHRCL